MTIADLKYSLWRILDIILNVLPSTINPKHNENTINKPASLFLIQ